MTHGAPFELMSRGELVRRRAQLLARIHRKFKTITETLPIGPLRLEFTRIADPDSVLDKICRDEDEQHLPYWAELWDSALGVSQFLIDHPPPKSVLDLGCGMGLTGMTAAAMGANVLLADLEPDALLFAKLNTLPYADRVCVRRLNWQTENLDEKFDLILGADVLYDRAQWTFLETFWKSHLCERGIVLLGEPGRQSGDQFIEWIASRGWSLERLEQMVASRGKPIRIFRLFNHGA